MINNHSPFIIAVLLITACLNAGEAPPPPVNAEHPPLVTVKIIEHYPTNDKILVGATSDTTVVRAKVTPADTGTYTWSYAKDLGWNPNGALNSDHPQIHTLPEPFPAQKNTEIQTVTFVSNTGKGTSSDQRYLNIVRPEHFADQASSQPTPKVTTIKLDKASQPYLLIDVFPTYTIEDQYMDKLASDTATFCNNHVQTREDVPWSTSIGVPPPMSQKDWKNNDSGTQADEIKVPILGTWLTFKGAFRKDLVGTDIVTSDGHVWQVQTLSASKEYDVTENTLHIVLTSVSQDGQTAIITATYMVNVR